MIYPMLVGTRIHKIECTYDLHLLERIANIATIPNEVHHRLAPCAGVRIGAIPTRWLVTPSEEPCLDAIVFDLCCPHTTSVIVEGLAEGALGTIDAAVTMFHAFEIWARLTRSAIVSHLAWRVAGMKTERVPGVHRDAFDDVELGVPVLLMTCVVEKPAADD